MPDSEPLPPSDGDIDELRAELDALKKHRDADRTEIAALQAKIKALEEADRKSTRLNSSHVSESRMPSSA